VPWLREWALAALKRRDELDAKIAKGIGALTMGTEHPLAGVARGGVSLRDERRHQEGGRLGAGADASAGVHPGSQVFRPTDPERTALTRAGA
jgi:hypothetical protein